MWGWWAPLLGRAPGPGGIRCKWGDGDLWEGEVVAGEEFKLAVIDGDGRVLLWEDGPNRKASEAADGGNYGTTADMLEGRFPEASSSTPRAQQQQQQQQQQQHMMTSSDTARADVGDERSKNPQLQHQPMSSKRYMKTDDDDDGNEMQQQQEEEHQEEASTAPSTAAASAPPQAPRSSGAAAAAAAADPAAPGASSSSSSLVPPWAAESVWYQIYPLGFFGCPQDNGHEGEAVPRLAGISGYVSHLEALGVGAVLFNPLFESDGHGYDTTDYLVS